MAKSEQARNETPAPDEYEDLSPEVMDIINRKVTAYSSRRQNAKTPQQFRAWLISQALMRYADLPTKLADGGDEKVIEDIVQRHVGRSDSYYHSAIHMHNMRAHLLVERDRDVARAEARTEAKNSANLYEHLGKLTGTLGIIAEKLQLAPPPPPPHALPAPAENPPKPDDGSSGAEAVPEVEKTDAD